MCFCTESHQVCHWLAGVEARSVPAHSYHPVLLVCVHQANSSFWLLQPLELFVRQWSISGHSLISFNSNAFSRLCYYGLKPKIRNPHSHGVQKSGAHSYAAGLPREVYRFIKVMFSGGFSGVFFHQNSLEMLHQREHSGAIDFHDKQGAWNRHSSVEKIDTE